MVLGVVVKQVVFKIAVGWLDFGLMGFVSSPNHMIMEIWKWNPKYQHF